MFVESDAYAASFFSFFPVCLPGSDMYCRGRYPKTKKKHIHLIYSFAPQGLRQDETRAALKPHTPKYSSIPRDVI